VKLRILDLFSGIGGISLGLERTGGFETAAFCEIDKAAQKVLKKHWPDVPIFEDVTTLSVKDIDGPIDIICGGFPCQDLSVAGKGAGLEGARSGLWWEFHRLIKEAQPKWVIIENVSVLRSRGLDQVLGSLAEIGYDAEWHCIPASAVGAPHRRDRIWIVAYPSQLQRDGSNDNSRVGLESQEEPEPRDRCWQENVAYSSSLGSPSQSKRDSGVLGEEGCKKERAGNKSSLCTSTRRPEVAHPSSERLQGSKRLRDYLEETLGEWKATPRPASQRCPISGGTLYSWDTEPGVGRVANGIPGRVDRLKQLGNAVVPQIPELIGRAILQST
jgi:DNA (cytosine-5)-methyltransferase 1